MHFPSKLKLAAPFLLLLLASGGLSSGPLWAAEEVVPAPPGSSSSASPEADATLDETGARQPEPPLPGADPLGPMHQYLSTNVEVLADKIDSFFGAPRIYEEASGTFLQFRGTTIYGRGGEWEFDGKVRAKLDLPYLKKKVNLVFESERDDDAQEDRILSGNAFNQTVDDKDLAASLQYAIHETKFWDVRLQPGVKIKWPLDPFVKVRSRWLTPLTETWLNRVTVTPGWYNSRGWEGRARVDFERATGGGSLFRISSEGVWLLDEAPNLTLVQAFFFSHPVTSRDQLAYEVGVGADTHPSFEDQGYFASVRYRRDIHRRWIFLELKPQIAFERENDFEADPSIALTLEMIFGSRYIEKPGS